MSKRSSLAGATVLLGWLVLGCEARQSQNHSADSPAETTTLSLSSESNTASGNPPLASDPQPAGSTQPAGPPDSAQAVRTRRGAHRRASGPCRHQPRVIPADAPLPVTVDDLLAEALGVGQQLTEQFSHTADAYEVRARIEYNVGCISEAEASWRRALEINPRYAYAVHGLGLVAAKRCDFRAAADLQRQALEWMPTLGDAARYAAEAHLRLGDAEQAIDILTEFLSNQPGDLETTVRLGQAQLAAGRYEAAQANFRTVLKQTPDVPRAQYGLALALARAGNLEEAEDAKATYRTIRREERRERYLRRQQQDDFQRHAEQLCQHYVSASRLYLSRQQVEKGIALCRRAARLAPDDVASRELYLSVAPRLGKWGEAFEVCTELVALKPSHLSYRMSLAALHEHRGEQDKAQAVYEATIELAPDQTAGHVALTRLHAQRQQYPEAVAHARQAVQKDASARHFVLLAEALAASASWDEAAAAVQRAIDLEPQTPEWRQLQQMIERQRPNP